MELCSKTQIEHGSIEPIEIRIEIEIRIIIIIITIIMSIINNNTNTTSNIRANNNNTIDSTIDSTINNTIDSTINNTTNSTTKNIVIFYPKDCADGTLSAAICYKAIGEKAHYIPIYSNESLQTPELEGLYGENSTIFFIGILPENSADFLYLCNKNKMVTGWTQNVSEKTKIASWRKNCPLLEKYLDNIVLSAEDSNSSLTWKILISKDNIPYIVQCISDMVSKKNVLFDSAEISSAVRYLLKNDPIFATILLNYDKKNLAHLFYAGFGINIILTEQKGVK